MQIVTRETESFKPITFVPTMVGFDADGNLVVKSYFLNSGAEAAAVITLHLEIYELANRLYPRQITTSTYDNLNVELPPGEAVLRVFKIANVDSREVVEHWKVNAKFSWQSME